MREQVALAELHSAMQRLGVTVAVAESLTGGLVLGALTSTPGASVSVRGGLVVYATDVKASLAGVDQELLDARGAVDPDVALGLAHGAQERLGADIGLGVTGVAGPDPQDGQPVGTVYIAVCTHDSEQVEKWHFDGDRSAIRQATVDVCVDVLSDLVAELADSPAAEFAVERESEPGPPR